MTRPTLDDLMLKHGSDKASVASQEWQWPQDYCRRTYEHLFDPIRDEPITMLELGWGEYCPQRRDHSNPDNGGRSARAWAEYFANGQVYVVDLTPKNFADRDEWPNIHLYDRTSQADAAALAAMHDASGDFDIIIDDASHVSSLTIRSFEILWPFVKPGGYYVIEDLHSSYHPWYFGPREANENPSAPVDSRHPTAMQYFKRIADEAFFRGTKRHGPKVNGSRFEWDCYPRKYWLGYEVESVSFCAPQLIVIRKRAEEYL